MVANTKRFVWLAGIVLAMGMIGGCGGDKAADAPEAATTEAAGGVPAGDAKTGEGASSPAAAVPAPDWAKTGTPGG
jgi:hypothetical protein